MKPSIINMLLSFTVLTACSNAVPPPEPPHIPSHEARASNVPPVDSGLDTPEPQQPIAPPPAEPQEREAPKKKPQLPFPEPLDWNSEPKPRPAQNKAVTPSLAASLCPGENDLILDPWEKSGPKKCATMDTKKSKKK